MLNWQNINLNLDKELLARIQLSAMLKSENPNEPIAWQSLIRDALDKAFPIATAPKKISKTIAKKTGMK